jgi:hypothetical protein
MENVRICVFTVPILFTIVKKGGDPYRESFFSGIAREFFQNGLSLVSKNLNTTLVEESSTEKCIQSMIRNKSDFLFSTTAYLGQDFNFIYPASLYEDLKVTIFSSYNMTSPDSKRFSDIAISLLTGISPGVMAISFAYIVACYMLFNLTSRHIFESRDRWEFGFETFAHFIQQESIEFDDFLRRLVCLMLSLTSFFVLISFGAIITTDLVVLEKPNLISSYDDVSKDPSIVPISLGALDIGKLLTSSGPHSRNDQFWQSIKGRHSLLSTSDKNVLDEVVKHGYATLHRKRVVLVPNELEAATLKSLCMTMPLLDSIMKGWAAYPYFSRDSEAESILMAFFMTQSIRPTNVGRRLQKNVRRAMDFGLFQHMFHFMDVSGVIPITSKRGDYERCMHEKLIMPDVPTTMSVKFENLNTVVYVYLLIVVVIFIIGIGERISSSKHKRPQRTRPATAHESRERRWLRYDFDEGRWIRYQ